MYLRGYVVVGKTSLIKRFIEQSYAKEYNVTVGAEFVSRRVELSCEKTVKLNIWDTVFVFVSVVRPRCVQEHDLQLLPRAAAAFLTFSVANRKSFERIRGWHEQFSEFASPFACVFLVGTKVDEKRQVGSEEAMELLKTIKGVMYFETSS